MDLYVLGVLVLCAVVPISGQRQALMFCTEVTMVNQTEVSISFDSRGMFTKHRHCSCHLEAVSPSALLHVSTIFTRPRDGRNDDQPTYGQDQGLAGPDDNNMGSRGQDKLNSTCDPFLSMMMMGGDPLHQCTGAVRNHSRLYVAMDRGQRYHVSLTNHRSVDVEARMTILVKSGWVSVMCERESEPARSEMCPCGYPGMYAAPFSPGGGDVSTSTRLTVAFVCVAVLLIIVAVVVGLWWWRRKRQEGEKDLEVVPPGAMATENQAYAPSNNASHASGLDRNPERDPHHNGPNNRYQNGPFDQEPELNLDLRTTPITQPLAKGSTDSGLYSLPSDKHIRPNNNSAPYQNAPNTIGPDQMYNPMAPSKSNSSLTGQGALHGSIDQLSPAEIDAMYAKPNKPGRQMAPPSGHQPPTRSASHDALNTAPHKTSMASLGSKSLNTSQPAVETDV